MRLALEHGTPPSGAPFNAAGPTRYIAAHGTAAELRGLDRAAARIAEIVAADGQHRALRVAVLAGGCSGFQYKFELDTRAAAR